MQCDIQILLFRNSLIKKSILFNPININKVKETLLIGKFLIFSLIIIFSSCSTDNQEQEEETPSNDRNGYVMNGEFYELTQSFLNINVDQVEENEADLFYHEIILTSFEVSVDNDNEHFIASESEEGQAIALILRSPMENTLEGNYPFGWEREEAFALVEGEMAISSASPSEFSIEGGTVTIEEQEGNRVSLQFDLVGENNQVIIGNYSGEFEQFYFER